LAAYRPQEDGLMETTTPTRKREARALAPSRRDFLRILGAGAIGLTLARCGTNAGTWEFAARRTKPLCGIFPITQTPFTPDDKIDLDCLAEEVRFIDRGRVHGFVWPQVASEWATLTEPERFAAMETIGATGKKLRPAIVFGVQGPDIAAVRRYVKHAEKTGADAIISLPPSETATPQAIVQYFQEIGKMTDLPLFVQAVGNVNVEALLEMFRTIPTMRYAKDEAGDPLAHFATLQQQTGNQLKIFSGGHGRKLIDEMNIGFSGSMPAASLADLYASSFDLWQAGKTAEAKVMHARTLPALDLMLDYGMEGMKYILVARGVFKTFAARKPRDQGFASAATIVSGGRTTVLPVDDKGRKTIDAMLQSLKPYFRA
jgi:4-hydroxy-tetrahydrodipicolinate synthase